LEYLFNRGSERSWVAGTVTKLLSAWPGWVAVLFDDGDALEVQLKRDAEGTAWRWVSPVAEDEAAEIEWVQCAEQGCSKWHQLPLTVHAADLPDRFVCSMNCWSAEQASCEVAEAPTQRGSSAFVGVGWESREGRWRASARHDGSKHNLGYFDDEQEAARAFDEKARQLRTTGQAHGGRAGTNWQRLNFPTAEEQH